MDLGKTVKEERSKEAQHSNQLTRGKKKDQGKPGEGVSNKEEISGNCVNEKIGQKRNNPKSASKMER